jgi:hypothetical protein
VGSRILQGTGSQLAKEWSSASTYGQKIGNCISLQPSVLLLREKVGEGLVTLVYVKSNDNLADIFTKGLAYPRFMTLIYRVCGVFDVYAATDCDSVTMNILSIRFWRLTSDLP